MSSETRGSINPKTLNQIVHSEIFSKEIAKLLVLKVPPKTVDTAVKVRKWPYCGKGYNLRFKKHEPYCEKMGEEQRSEIERKAKEMNYTDKFLNKLRKPSLQIIARSLKIDPDQTVVNLRAAIVSKVGSQNSEE